MTRIGIKDTYVTHGSKEILRKNYGVDAQAIANAAENLCRDPALR
jgi:transketolase C-terminal domain/subunit